MAKLIDIRWWWWWYDMNTDLVLFPHIKVIVYILFYESHNEYEISIISPKFNDCKSGST